MYAGGSNATLPSVPSVSNGIQPLADDQHLPDLVLESGMAENVPNVPTENASLESEQALEAANVLLSLHDDVRDDTQDEDDDNALLMPIGGTGAPVDMAHKKSNWIN